MAMLRASRAGFGSPEQRRKSISPHGQAPRSGPPMIRIAITAEAFEAMAATIPLDSVGYERERTARGAVSSGSKGAGSAS